ncbi:MAG TPA: hypothetical protein VGF46_03565, partial [Gaiellales bacterium]
MYLAEKPWRCAMHELDDRDDPVLGCRVDALLRRVERKHVDVSSAWDRREDAERVGVDDEQSAVRGTADDEQSRPGIDQQAVVRVAA